MEKSIVKLHKHLLIFHLFIVQNDERPGTYLRRASANYCWHLPSRYKVKIYKVTVKNDGR